MSETADNKFCKDCKWCSGPANWWTRLWNPDMQPYEQSRCMRTPITVEPMNIVSGAPAEIMYPTCHRTRISVYSGDCGPQGENWEPRT